MAFKCNRASEASSLGNQTFQLFRKPHRKGERMGEGQRGILPSNNWQWNFATLLQSVRRTEQDLKAGKYFFFLRLWGAGSKPAEVKMSQFVIVNGPICGLAYSEISIRFCQAFCSHICHICIKQQQQEGCQATSSVRENTNVHQPVWNTGPNGSPETQ